VVTLDAIRELADRIAESFRPDQIVLFGSYAYGQPAPDSDVDLLIVMGHEGKSWDAAARIRGTVRPRFPVDLLVRTPQKLRERLVMGDVFLREIVTRGRVLYEASHRRVG
jgi:predicted nucleotidyltransferase